MSSIAPMILVKKKKDENQKGKKKRNWLKPILIVLVVVALFFIIMALGMVTFQGCRESLCRQFIDQVINPPKQACDAPVRQHDTREDERGRYGAPVHEAIPIVGIWPFALAVNQNVRKVNTTVNQSG